MRVGIAGIGLIGGSIALRAAYNGAHVIGWDADAGNLAFASARRIVAETADSFETLASGCDVLVLATPLEPTLELLARLRALDVRPELTLDVASVKVPVARAAAGLAGFAGTHPIAGSERSGPQAARLDLFGGRTWTVDAGAPATAREAAARFVASLGARPLEIASDEHDRILALTSHLPQIVSVALGAHLARYVRIAPTLELTGTGMRSLLRLGGSSWEVWRAVLRANRVSVAQEVRRLAAILTEAAESLEHDRVDELAPRFAAAADALARLNDSPN